MSKSKLDAVIKVKSLKLNDCKLEIAVNLKRVKQLKDMRDRHTMHIGEAYAEREKSLKRGQTNLETQKFSHLIDEKKKHISRIDNELKFLTEEYQQLLKDYIRCKNDLELVENISSKRKEEQAVALKKIDDRAFEESKLLWWQIRNKI